MPDELPDPVFDAFLAASKKGILPTSLDTAGLRKLAAELRRHAYFTARGTSTAFISAIKYGLGKVTSGEWNEATMRAYLLEVIRGTGYTPEGGFPDAPAGSVPPALKGTIQDLSSWRRIDLIVDTQLKLSQGAGLMMAAHTPERIEEFPAFEVYTLLDVEEPRDWAARWTISGGIFYGNREADTPLGAPGRLIALKGDPVWGELGSSENFDDALDVDFPPFYFRSGKWLREVSRREVLSLGVTGPDGETPEEWIATNPRTMDGPLPRPRISMGGTDPELRDDFVKETGAVPVAGKPDLYEITDEDGGDFYDDDMTLEQIREEERRIRDEGRRQP
jgi:hypothetical protein